MKVILKIIHLLEKEHTHGKMGINLKEILLMEKKEGYGIYTWPEGGSYTGNFFVNNLREGKGILKWPNGKIYDGLFSKGKPHGVGILAINDHKYDVEFNEGNLDKKTLKVDNYELKN